MRKKLKGQHRPEGPAWLLARELVERRLREGEWLDVVEKLVYYVVMIKLNVHEAKTHLSKYLAKLKAGERILLCKRNHPIAEITALPEPPTHPRPIGLAKGRFTVPGSFFAPLPDVLLEAFEGTHE